MSITNGADVQRVGHQLRTRPGAGTRTRIITVSLRVSSDRTCVTAPWPLQALGCSFCYSRAGCRVSRAVLTVATIAATHVVAKTISGRSHKINTAPA
jgi:hypothetical protein